MDNKAEHQVQEKMEEEEEQLRRDHELALALQQQERDEFTMIEMIDGDEEEEEEEDEAGSYSSSEHDGDVSFIDSAEFDPEMENLEDGYSDYDDEEEVEDDIDPDELSYEELMALGEAVGEESRGLSPEEIPSTLSPYVCTDSLQSNITIDRCVICQVEYEQGEQVVALKCVHPFHPDCIKQWLQIKKTCPICSTEVAPNKRTVSEESQKELVQQ